MSNLLGHDRGPGIAAGVILMTLIDQLIKADVLAKGDKARILAIADSKIVGWGDTNIAVRDAREVIKKLGLGA